MDDNEKMILIRRNDFFSQLTEGEYESLNIIHNFVTAQAGAYIYLDNDYGKKLYFVKEGFIKLGVIDDSGNELLKDIIYPGDLFGQLPDMTHGTSPEFAQAYRKDVSLCCFDIEHFESVIAANPKLALQFMRMVAGKAKRAEQRIVNLLQKDVRTRLLYFLWTLAASASVEDNTYVIERIYTHDDIARLIACSRQTVTKILGKLEEDGIITTTSSAICITNVALLRTLANTGAY